MDTLPPVPPVVPVPPETSIPPEFVTRDRAGSLVSVATCGVVKVTLPPAPPAAVLVGELGLLSPPLAEIGTSLKTPPAGISIPIMGAGADTAPKMAPPSPPLPLVLAPPLMEIDW